MFLNQAQDLLSLVLIIAASGSLLLPFLFLAQIIENLDISDQVADAIYLLLSDLLLAELSKGDDLILQFLSNKGSTESKMGLSASHTIRVRVIHF